MLQAMETIGLDEDERSHIFSLIFGILHLGNVMFQESNNDVAYVQMEDCKFFKIFYSWPAFGRPRPKVPNLGGVHMLPHFLRRATKSDTV